jgi:hypothetical protein
MDVKKLKEEYVGKMLLTIIDLNTDDSIVVETLRRITAYDYGERVDNAKLLLFENNRALVFVDFDSDGYRSGDWFLVDIKNILDRGQTTGIKHINSVVRNIEYFEISSKEYVLITTDEYVIKMGQDNVDDYYPSNFFDVEECKSFALGIRDYEVIDFKKKEEK